MIHKSGTECAETTLDVLRDIRSHLWLSLWSFGVLALLGVIFATWITVRLASLEGGHEQLRSLIGSPPDIVTSGNHAYE